MMTSASLISLISCGRVIVTVTSQLVLTALLDYSPSPQVRSIQVLEFKP